MRLEPPHHSQSRCVAVPIWGEGDARRESFPADRDALDALSYAMTTSPEQKKRVIEQRVQDEKVKTEVEALTQIGKRRLVIDEEEK